MSSGIQSGMQIKGMSKVIPFTTVNDTVAYSSGDYFGAAAAIALTDAARANGGTGTIVGVTATDKDNKKIDVSLHFYSFLPTNQTNNAAYAPVSTERASYYMGKINIVAADWTTNNACAECDIKNQELLFQCDPTTSTLYVQLVLTANASGAFTSLDALTFKVKIYQD